MKNVENAVEEFGVNRIFVVFSNLGYPRNSGPEVDIDSILMPFFTSPRCP